MTIQVALVLIALVFMIVTLVLDYMRPGMILFFFFFFFLCAGLISPVEIFAGFSYKGVITVALLFLVSEGVRKSGALSSIIKKLLPVKKTTIFKSHLRILPSVAFISAFLNNTPVVVIFAPMIKQWAERVKLPATKFLIPLSYITILGGMCTLIGTSTNLVVYGMITSAGYEGFTMFELGKVGIFIALAGLIYLSVFSSRLLPDRRDSLIDNENVNRINIVEAVIGPRFPGVNKTLKDFNFERHYGAEVKQIKRAGDFFSSEELLNIRMKEGDTLVLVVDKSFVATWGESSVFVMLANGQEDPTEVSPIGSKRKILAITLLGLMIIGATVGELPVVKEMFPNIQLDMFFFVSVTTVIMAWARLFSPRKYTKYISWDILITIACAFAVSKAMVNSGVSDLIASRMIQLSHYFGPHVLLAALFLITNIFTEVITNNAAAALSFPLALSISSQLGVSPMPFFVVICVAASASFATPIGYQTNLIVQGIGDYKFTDFLRVGLPLNVITFIISMLLIPLIWPF